MKQLTTAKGQGGEWSKDFIWESKNWVMGIAVLGWSDVEVNIFVPDEKC